MTFFPAKLLNFQVAAAARNFQMKNAPAFRVEHSFWPVVFRLSHLISRHQKFGSKLK